MVPEMGGRARNRRDQESNGRGGRRRLANTKVWLEDNLGSNVAFARDSFAQRRLDNVSESSAPHIANVLTV